MNTHYSPLFRVDFRHDYFSHGLCRVVKLVPTAGTQQLMLQLGIRLKEGQASVEAFYSDGDPPAGQLLLADQPVLLSFILRAEDPVFLNYTDLPGIISAGATQYFTNLEGEVNFQPSQELFLFSDEEPETARPRNWQHGDLGILSVYIGETAENGSHILVNGTVTPAAFKIEFPARATRWRYHLIDQSDAGYEGFQLTNTDGQVVSPTDAAPQQSATLPNGTEAVVLLSPQKIPLRERPGQVFQLTMTRKGDAQGTPITMPLPSASAQQITGIPSNTGEETDFYSDLYVYI